MTDSRFVNDRVESGLAGPDANCVLEFFDVVECIVSLAWV